MGWDDAWTGSKNGKIEKKGGGGGGQTENTKRPTAVGTVGSLRLGLM